MSYVFRLAKLEALSRPLSPDECREANRLRARVRSNDRLKRRYREDPEYRARKLAYVANRRELRA